MKFKNKRVKVDFPAIVAKAHQHSRAKSFFVVGVTKGYFLLPSNQRQSLYSRPIESAFLYNSSYRHIVCNITR